MRYINKLLIVIVLQLALIQVLKGQEDVNIEKLREIVENQIEADYIEADTIVQLFSLSKSSRNNHNFNPNFSKTKTKFSFGEGYNLRFYLIGISKDSEEFGQISLRLHKYNEEEDIPMEMYFELVDNTTDLKISKLDYQIISRSENILLLDIPGNFSGDVIAIATQFNIKSSK